MATVLPKLNGIYVCFAIPEHALQVLCSDMRRPISDPWVDRTSHTIDTVHVVICQVDPEWRHGHCCCRFCRYENTFGLRQLRRSYYVL